MRQIAISRQLRIAVGHYLLSKLEDEELDRFPDQSLSGIRKTALSEKSYEVKRIGTLNAIRDWFLGLGMSVAFSYVDIANIMRSWGFKVNEDDEDDYYDKCDLYWDLLTQVVYDAA